MAVCAGVWGQRGAPCAQAGSDVSSVSPSAVSRQISSVAWPTVSPGATMARMRPSPSMSICRARRKPVSLRKSGVAHSRYAPSAHLPSSTAPSGSSCIDGISAPSGNAHSTRPSQCSFGGSPSSVSSRPERLTLRGGALRTSGVSSSSVTLPGQITALRSSAASMDSAMGAPPENTMRRAIARQARVSGR